MDFNSGTTSKLTFHNRVEIFTILNDYQLGVFEIVNYVCLSTAISLLGIAGNIINIVVFLKQGFTNTVNISFFGLAISDLCCLITLLWVVVWLNPFMSNSGVPVNYIQIQHLTGSWPHAVCGRITSYITVYVTAERCLCILLPLKVKQLVSPTRTAIVVGAIFAINVLAIIPEYITSYLDWKFFPESNRTVLTIFYRGDRQEALATVALLYFFVGTTSFLSLIVFTVILAFKLQQSSEWRKTAVSGSDKQSCTNNRQKRTVKMIVVIATVLIVCYTPGVVMSLGCFMVPEFYLLGRYHRICISLWSIACVFNAVNSSINVILYYKMSSNYRQTFKIVFCRGGTVDDIDDC